MLQLSADLLSQLLSSTARPLAAQSMTEFLVEIRGGYKTVYKALLGNDNPQAGLDSLDEAFTRTRRLPRHRRVLELCAWPVFEKPTMPSLGGEAPGFLWLFAVPVLVQLPLNREGLVMLPPDLLRTAEFIETLENSGCFNFKAILSGFSTLYTRDDLHAFGPRGIAERFIGAETEPDFEVPAPLPIVRDPEIESGRTVTLYALMAARLPAGENHLFQEDVAWPREAVDALLSQDFRNAGIAVEKLESDRGCSMSEALYRCLGPGLREMERWVDLGLEHYALTSLYLAIPADGMAELVGVTAQGEEFLLSSTFPYVEPSAELAASCERICKARHLPFKGMFASAVLTSSALH